MFRSGSWNGTKERNKKSTSASAGAWPVISPEFSPQPAKSALNVGILCRTSARTFVLSVRFALANKFYQCDPQPRSIARRIIVPMTETKSEPRQPKRFEKKANIHAISRWKRQRRLPMPLFHFDAGQFPIEKSRLTCSLSRESSDFPLPETRTGHLILRELQSSNKSDIAPPRPCVSNLRWQLGPIGAAPGLE